MATQTEIGLGDDVMDSITGFTGVAISIAQYINGCVRVEVQARGLQDGKPLDGVWLDEQRLTTAPKATSGGPMGDPPRFSTPPK